MTCGAVTSHVLTSEERLSDFNRAEEGGEDGGSTAGITVAEGRGTRVEPTLGRITNIEVANEESDAVGVCRPWSCPGTESLSELLEGAFWLIMQDNDSTMAIVEAESERDGHVQRRYLRFQQ